MCIDEHRRMNMSYIPTQLQTIWEELDRKEKQFIITAGYEVYQYTQKVSQGKEQQKIQKEYERSLQDLRDILYEKQELIESYESKLKTTKHKKEKELQDQQKTYMEEKDDIIQSYENKLKIERTKIKRELQEQEDSYNEQKMKWKKLEQDSQRKLQERVQEQEDSFRRQREVWRQREQELQDRMKQVESSSLDMALKKVREHMADVGVTYTSQIQNLQMELKKWQGMYEKKQEEVSQLMSTVQQQSLHSTAYAKSQKKGETGEYEVMKALSDSFYVKGLQILDTSKEGGVGDIQVIDTNRNVRCMIEVKNYDSCSVPTKEVEKCERDVRNTKEICCSVFISLGSPITGHAHEDIGWVTDSDGKTKPILYLVSRDELDRIGMWVHILMYLTTDAHQRLTEDMDRKSDMIGMSEYQKDVSEMIERMKPLKKALHGLKLDMGRQIQTMDGMIVDMMEEGIRKMNERGILVQNQIIQKKNTQMQQQEEQYMNDWKQNIKSQYFKGTELTKYLKERGVVGRRVYTIRDRYCDKVQEGDESYRENLPANCKLGETYLKMKF